MRPVLFLCLALCLASSGYAQALVQVELATGTILTKYHIEIRDARSKGSSGSVIARSAPVGQ